MTELFCCNINGGFFLQPLVFLLIGLMCHNLGCSAFAAIVEDTTESDTMFGASGVAWWWLLCLLVCGIMGVDAIGIVFGVGTIGTCPIRAALVQGCLSVREVHFSIS